MRRRTFLFTSAKALCSAGILHTLSAKAQEKTGRQIGIYTRPWSEYDYRVAFDAMVQAGYNYAGLMTAKGGLVIDVNTEETAARHIGIEAKDRGLTILSVYGGDFYADRSKTAAVRGLKKLIDNVQACEGRSLLLGGTGKKKEFNNYYKAVAECCDYAMERNITLTLKPHGGLNATGPQCRKIIARVNHANFQLWYDPGNIFYYSDGSLDPVKDVDTVADIVKGMCVKDFKPPKEVLVTPGTGQVDFPSLFAKLAAAGFIAGALVVECLAAGDLASIAENAVKARLYLQNILS